MAEGNVMKDEYEYSSEMDDEDDDEECRIVFDASVDDMSKFDTFLQMYKPSFVKKSDGIKVISVKAPKYDNYRSPDLTELLEDWEAMQKNRQVITPNAIFEMAKKHNCVRGKWLIYKFSGIKIDRAWAAIARAVAVGRCGIAAKVSTIDDIDGENLGRYSNFSKNYQYVRVYNSDFTDMESVENLEHDIRKTGIRCCITYKPDVYSYLNIDRYNKWTINATIYKSQFDLYQENQR